MNKSKYQIHNFRKTLNPNNSSPSLINLAQEIKEICSTSKKEETAKQKHLQEIQFINSKVKKDSLANYQTLNKSIKSIYHSDFHKYQENYINKLIDNKNKKQTNIRFNCPSIYKNSIYQDSYPKVINPSPEKYKASNSRSFFNQSINLKQSTYQGMYQNPQKNKIIPEQPIKPSPPLYFVPGLQFKGSSIYDNSYLKFPKIDVERSPKNNKDHLAGIGLRNSQCYSEYKQNFINKENLSPQKLKGPSDNDHFFTMGSLQKQNQKL